MKILISLCTERDSTRRRFILLFFYFFFTYVSCVLCPVYVSHPVYIVRFTLLWLECVHLLNPIFRHRQTRHTLICVTDRQSVKCMNVTLVHITEQNSIFRRRFQITTDFIRTNQFSFVFHIHKKKTKWRTTDDEANDDDNEKGSAVIKTKRKMYILKWQKVKIWCGK